LARIKDEIRDTKRYRCADCTEVVRLPSSYGERAYCPTCAKERFRIEPVDTIATFIDV